MSDTELNKIRKKIADYYIHGESGASGNVSSKKKSSNGKNLRNRGYSDSTDIKAGKGSNLQKGLEAGRKRVLAAIKKTK